MSSDDIQEPGRQEPGRPGQSISSRIFRCVEANGHFIQPDAAEILAGMTPSQPRVPAAQAPGVVLHGSMT